MMYDKKAFESFASQNWKLKKNEIEEAKDHVNDTIRLFSIAAKTEYRDKVISLMRGRAMTRDQLDGARSYITAIFEDFAEDFNNASRIFDKPEKSAGLLTIDQLDPNDQTRINIERDAKYLYQLWKKRMYEYKLGVKKWTSDTGGGSGNPLNFHNWDEVSVSEFGNYGGGSGRAIRKEWMAYILLLDMKTEYSFSSSFDPPPENAIVEDGAQPPPTKRQRVPEHHSAVEEAGLKMCDTVSTSFGRVADALINLNSPQPPVQQLQPATDARSMRRQELRENMGDMDQANSLVLKLQQRQNELMNLPDDSPMKGVLLYANDKALRQACRALVEISRRDDDEPTQMLDVQHADDEPSDG